ncbi:high mobility group protein 1 [Fusobacterium periodonticum]|uniref:high mobility group protein 1 n=1 Tax=Fusobacterium periodonticum TaxID=860 RepID=UPI0028D13B9F|nr:high mobility group protein 1 [Fusobacterium periodonticum]
MAEIIQKIKSAFKSITSNEETEQNNNSGIEREIKKIEKNEYEGFANGFPEWDLQPPQAPVRRRR